MSTRLLQARIFLARRFRFETGDDLVVNDYLRVHGYAVSSRRSFELLELQE